MNDLTETQFFKADDSNSNNNKHELTLTEADTPVWAISTVVQPIFGEIMSKKEDQKNAVRPEIKNSTTQKSFWSSFPIGVFIRRQLKEHLNLGPEEERAPPPVVPTVPRDSEALTYEERERAYLIHDRHGVLGLLSDADQASIQKAARPLLVEFHPDKQGKKSDDVDILYEENLEEFNHRLAQWKQEEYSLDKQHILFAYSPLSNTWEVYWLKHNEEQSQMTVPQYSPFAEVLESFTCETQSVHRANLQALLENTGHTLFEDYISLRQRNLNQFLWVKEVTEQLLSPEELTDFSEVLSFRMELDIALNQEKIIEKLIKKKDKQIAAERGERLRLEEEIRRLEKELCESGQVEENEEESKNNRQIQEQNEQEGCSNFKQTNQCQDSKIINPNQFFASPTHRNNNDDNITTQQSNNRDRFFPAQSECDDKTDNNKTFE